MRHSEDVTFGGSDLDRVAALRGDAARIGALLAEGKVLAIWRGKPLFDGSALAWLPADSVVLEGATTPVFLGLENGRGWFAADISHWQPEAAEAIPAGILDNTRQTHPALPETLAFEDLRSHMADISPRDAELAATGKAVLQWHSSHRFCAACGMASVQVQAGWQRHCPACNTQHFPRTDPVVIMLVERDNRLLLGRSPGWPEGMYSLLAGFVEPGETLEAAVRREVAEETGVKVGPVRYLASQPWPFPASLMLGAWGEGVTEEITLDPVELEDALWVTREELVTVLAGEHPLIRAGRKGAIAHFLMRNWLADRLD